MRALFAFLLAFLPTVSNAIVYNETCAQTQPVNYYAIKCYQGYTDPDDYLLISRLDLYCQRWQPAPISTKGPYAMYVTPTPHLQTAVHSNGCLDGFYQWRAAMVVVPHQGSPFDAYSNWDDRIFACYW